MTEQITITTEYDLFFTNQLIKKLLMSTRSILLKYYAETDMVAVLEDLEKQGKDIAKLGFMDALAEFELRGINRLVPLAGWLTVKKKEHD